MFAEEVEEHAVLELDAIVGGVSLLMYSMRVDICCCGSGVAVGRMQAVDGVVKRVDREAHVAEEEVVDGHLLVAGGSVHDLVKMF